MRLVMSQFMSLDGVVQAAGGAEEDTDQCGWLRDRYGLSWQIFPSELGEVLFDPDPRRAERSMRTMLAMVKIDIAAVRAAAVG